MLQRWLLGCLEFRYDPLGQDLAQFDAPLIKRIDLPDRSLCKHTVFVERHQFAQSLRSQPFRQDHVRRAIAFEGTVRNEPVGRSLRPDLFRSLAKRERLRLCEHIRHQQIVVIAQWVQRLKEADEITRDEFRSLVNELIERVLAVGPRLAPEDRTSLVFHARAVAASHAFRYSPWSTAASRPGSA